MYIVVVEFEVSPEHNEDFRQAMLEQAANSLEREEACRQFDVCFDQDNPAKCFLYEKYEDRAAFDAHLQSEHFKQFDATVSGWLVEKTVQTWNQANPIGEISQ